MEGLIPYVYRMIIQYRRSGGVRHLYGGLWLNESSSSSTSPSMAYMRLPGDSGRYMASDIQLFAPSSFSSPATTPMQSPLRPSTSPKRS
ncbi:hypothetical protein J5N97_030305 [Dioscorea zingiberensis]|uniref:Uncharacterized protein n=1 Tax=Dioscorea zingiberensis TaxID=325984 RepID=A0A9D5H3Z9_9LILI|nr:hypothetical protein J5N97_030305 [Dioscorea zingiberensis]